MEKCKNRMDLLADELERVIVAKEGESFKDTGVQHAKNPAGRRALGKAVVKGGLLLKGKNPVSVSTYLQLLVVYSNGSRSSDKRTMYGTGCLLPRIPIERLFWKHRPCDRNISTSNYLAFSGR